MIIALCAAFMVVMFAYPVVAATMLIMVTSDHCPFCRAWERDVGAVYDKSPYASALPLNRVEMGNTMPNDVTLEAPVIGTPTFIIIRDGREIDRQRGYSNAEMFWWWVSEHATK